MTLIFRLLAISLLAVTPGFGADSDRLADAVSRLRGADCIAIEFLSMTKSYFFDHIDTVDGDAYLATDSRYRVRLGPDTYLHTGDTLYSYSALHNQVTVEGGMSYFGQAEHVNWLRRLDDWYNWRPENSWLFRLTRKESGTPNDLPEEMKVRVDSLQERIKWLEYEDINDDLNRLIIRRQRLDFPCRDSLLAPHFPDSVEIIRLP